MQAYVAEIHICHAINMYNLYFVWVYIKKLKIEREKKKQL